MYPVSLTHSPDKKSHSFTNADELCSFNSPQPGYHHLITGCTFARSSGGAEGAHLLQNSLALVSASSLSTAAAEQVPAGVQAECVNG